MIFKVLSFDSCNEGSAHSESLMGYSYSNNQGPAIIFGKVSYDEDPFKIDYQNHEQYKTHLMNNPKLNQRNISLSDLISI